MEQMAVHVVNNGHGHPLGLVHTMTRFLLPRNLAPATIHVNSAV